MTNPTNTEQVQTLAQNEIDLLRNGEAIRNKLVTARSQVEALERDEASNREQLRVVRSILDGVGLGQRYETELNAARLMREEIERKKQAESGTGETL